eukprot:gene3859-4395_t
MDNHVIEFISIELAIGIACHSAIRSIDDLGEIVKRKGDGSNVGNFRLHRTNCTKLLTNGSSIKDDLAEQLIDKKYSVLVDESTDVSTDKHMVVMIRFFNEILNKISAAFASLVPVSSTKGEILLQALEDCLSHLGLTLTTIAEVECRLPPTKNLFKGFRYFYPVKVLSQKARLPFGWLPLPSRERKMLSKSRMNMEKSNLLIGLMKTYSRFCGDTEDAGFFKTEQMYLSDDSRRRGLTKPLKYYLCFNMLF